MRKSLILLLVLALCFSCVGCAGGNTQKDNYDQDIASSDGKSEIPLSREEALAAAKQECVNFCCEEKDVSRIKIVYGTENISKMPSDDNCWKVELKGYFYTVNSYGETDYDKNYFNYNCNVERSWSGYGYDIFEYFGCKVY